MTKPQIFGAFNQIHGEGAIRYRTYDDYTDKGVQFILNGHYIVSDT